MLDEAILRRLVQPGARVALGDGSGVPSEAVRGLCAVAADVGDVELLLGWVPVALADLHTEAFCAVRAIMGGYGLRRAIDEGTISYVPARLGAVPALLNGPLRPDVLVASMRRGVDGGWRFTTEVAWLRAAVDAGAIVAAIERPASPLADAGPPVDPDRVVLVGESDALSTPYHWSEPTDTDRAIAGRVAALLPEGVRIEVAPGPIGNAVFEALTSPIHVDTGILTDAVVGLDERGLLASDPVAPYISGTQRIYEWADGRPLAHRLEFTHDPIRLSSGRPFVAVHTALQLDLDGQLNVESVAGSAVAGIGGQPDYAYAAARSADGLSIVAVPTARGGHRTLVERLEAPASTASHDIEVIVTELGVADLRGLDRAGRRRAIARLWER